jgi:hypothetical protein
MPTTKRIAHGFRMLVAFVKGGPGGQPLVTHHRLHKD